MELEIEFIDEGKASEMWDKIFELLEARRSKLSDTDQRIG